MDVPAARIGLKPASAVLRTKAEAPPATPAAACPSLPEPPSCADAAPSCAPMRTVPSPLAAAFVALKVPAAVERAALDAAAAPARAPSAEDATNPAALPAVKLGPPLIMPAAIPGACHDRNAIAIAASITMYACCKVGTVGRVIAVSTGLAAAMMNESTMSFTPKLTTLPKARSAMNAVCLNKPKGNKIRLKAATR